MANMLAAYLERPEHISFETQEPNEQIILLLRAHPITVLHWFVIAVIFAILPLLFFRNIAFFGFSPTNLDVIRATRIISIVWELVILGFVIEQFLLYYFNVYIVTNLRVIDIEFGTLIDKKVSETRLVEIEDITFTQNGIFRSIFNYGDVLIQTAGPEREFTFYAVPRPGLVVTIIQGLLPAGGGP